MGIENQGKKAKMVSRSTPHSIPWQGGYITIIAILTPLYHPVSSLRSNSNHLFHLESKPGMMLTNLIYSDCIYFSQDALAS